MAFWNRKRKQKNNEDDAFLDPELDLEKEFQRQKKQKISDDEFDKIEHLQYVRTQCDQVIESSRYISQMKEEYQVVNAYLKDVQKIDTCKDTQREQLRTLASQAIKLNGKKDKYKKKQGNLSPQRFAQFERFVDDFPEALTAFQNDEKYLQTVKHDMHLLEAEKVAVREDRKKAAAIRKLVRNLSLVILVTVIAVAMIFLVSGELSKHNGQIAFMVVLFITVVLAVLAVVTLSMTVKKSKESDRKLNRAITLLNKTKIKYVNIANSLEYQKAKYGVKNGYQLSHEYELYLMDVKSRERYQNSEKEMDATVVAINQILRSLELYDVGVWESQLEALADEREMVEVRHSLNIRRQKLREQIDYNMGRIEEAKKGVLNFMKAHPKETDAIMQIVDSYDMDME